MINKNRTIIEPGKQETVFVWYFNAPRQRLFSLYTDPALVPNWWGPEYLQTFVEKMEVRPGGQWRILQHDPNGNTYRFHGVYHEVKPYESLVYTFEYEGTPGHVLLETVTFLEEDGVTKVIDQSVYQSVEDRDEMVEMGMEAGAEETYRRILELLSY